MEIFQIIFGIVSIICAAIALFFAFRAERIVKQTQARRVKEPKPKQFVVPGKGMFSGPPPKKKPIYHSDAKIWEKEQDEKKRG
tara:strand:+ start:7969 stop:8217 length:249 start_codon:yes stop_codon:yes gene_type:complete